MPIFLDLLRRLDLHEGLGSVHGRSRLRQATRFCTVYTMKGDAVGGFWWTGSTDVQISVQHVSN